MTSFPDEQSPSPPRAVPLGRLLVERGLLTEEQLIEGLLEQDRTGDRLGTVLIGLGFIDAPTVAMALATQHGGPLKTEYGFATGFDPGEPTDLVMAPPPSRDPVSSQPLSSELRLTDEADVMTGGSPTHAEPTASPEHDVVAPNRSAISLEPADFENGAASPPMEPGTTATPLTGASSEHPSATIADPTVAGAANDSAEAPGENAHTQSGLDAAFGELQAFRAEHDRALSQLGATIAELDAAQAELEAANTRIGDLERELVAAREQLDERRSKSAELENKLAAAQLAAETAIAALRRVTEAPP
jgi:flagellin-like hook-associated protein FlgL